MKQQIKFKKQHKKYPEYKDSGVEWIGEMPDGWDVRKLKFSSSVLASNIDKKSYGDEENVLLCNYTDVYKNNFIDGTMSFMPATASNNQINKLSLVSGDVVITKDSETPDDIGVPAFIKETVDNLVCGYHLYLLRTEKKQVLGEYLFRYLQAQIVRAYFETSSSGITRFGLGSLELRNLPIIFPSLDKQSLISSYLDQKTSLIDQIIAKKKKLIELLKEKRAAVINQAVTRGLDADVELVDSGVEWIGKVPKGWRIRRFKWASKFAYGSALAEEVRDIDGDVQVFGSNGVVGNHSKSITSGETIIIGRKGSCGKVQFSEQACFPIDTTFYVDSNYTSLNLRWLYYLLLIMKLDESNQDSAVPGLSRTMVYSRLIPYISLEEQKKIASFLDEKMDEIDVLAKKVEESIALLQEYKTSLISHVVTGKVRV